MDAAAAEVGRIADDRAEVLHHRGAGRGAQLLERRGEQPLQFQSGTDPRGTGVGHADPCDGVVAALAEPQELHVLLARDRDDHARSRLAEERREWVDPVALEQFVEPDACTDPEAQGGVDERGGEAAVREIVGGVQQALAGGGGEQRAELLLACEVRLRWRAAQVTVDDPGPCRAVELEVGAPEQVQVVAGVLPPRGDATPDVVDHAHDRHDRSRMDRHVAGLVVEAHVATGDRDPQLEAGIRETLDGARELPHHLGVLGAAEVEAVADRDRGRAGDGDVAVRLGEGELRAEVRVEVGVAAVGIGGEGDPETALLVDADHARIVGVAEGGVAHDVAVVLVGDPAHVGEVGAADKRQQLLLQRLAVARPVEPLGTVGSERIHPGRVGDRPFVDGPVDGDGARVDIDDGLAVPGDDESAGLGDLAEHARLDIPLLRHGQEALELVGLDDRHHALLALRHEDLLRRERGIAQQYLVERDRHAAIAVARELGGGARDAGRAQILDALDQVTGEQLEAALDEHLLGEGVSHLHGRTLGRPAGGEGVRGENGCPADPVAAGARPEEHHLVARTLGVGQVQVFVPQHANRERVDERIGLVDRVEPGFAADVRQAKTVGVEADAADDPWHHTRRVWMVDGPEAQRIHDGHRPRPHRDDVAHDAANTGCGTLERLDIAGVVVALDLEGDRPAFADVDDAGVLAHADHEVLGHLGADLLAELAQPHLGALVRAVLAPHHRVHGEFAARRAATEEVPDALVLVALEAERGVRLLLLGGGDRVGDRVEPTRGGYGLGEVGHAAGLPFVGDSKSTEGARGRASALSPPRPRR